MIVSKRWQKKQSLVQHTSLAIIWGGTLFWVQLELDTWQKLLLIALTCILTLAAARRLTQRYARSLVRVFELKIDVTTHLVQRALNASYIPFTRQTLPDGARFTIRNRGLILIIESYPLNLPIDDHIRPIPASKIEIRGITATNEAFVERLSLAINKTVAASQS